LKLTYKSSYILVEKLFKAPFLQIRKR